MLNRQTNRCFTHMLCLLGNTKTPRSKQKRVARMDKIMDDMKRHQKMDQATDKDLMSELDK